MTTESEAKYRGLLEAAPDAMVVVNQGGDIVLLNLQAEKRFGYHRDELVGQPVKNIIPEGFAERLLADDLRSPADALAQQIGTGIELTGRRKDGSEFPIEIMLSPLASAEGILVTAAIRDISVRKDAEEHLAQMESRYRGLLEAAPDAMVVVDQGGDIVLLNLQAEKRFGYRRDELVGQPVKNIIPEGFAERLLADDLRSAEDALAQQIGTGIELTGRRKDGSEFPIEIMLSPLASADGILVTAAIRDITTRTKAEALLLQKVEELNRSNEELGRLELSLDERLRFESLLSELSAGLIHISLNDLDDEIGRGLRRVGEFLKVDRANLHEYVVEGAMVRSSWAVEGVEPLSRVMEPDQFPWATEQLRGGHMVRFSRLGELPEQAAIDRQSFQRGGTQSDLSLPLGAGDSLLGVLSFDSVRTERAWPDELLPRLQLLSEVFTGALERRRAELALNERLRFEALLSELSAVFSGLPALEIDYEITRGLHRIVDFLEVDRGMLLKFSEDRLSAQITHSWAADAVAQAPSAIALDQIPWTAAQLQGGVAVRFSRLEELPEEEAAMDRRTYLTLGIKSRVGIPLMIGDTVQGVLSFSALAAERTWRDDLVQRLRLFGEVFANSLARKQSELEAQGLRNDLAHAGRVATIGELTTSLAHELNQPLTAILSNAQAGQRLLETAPVDLDEVGEILKDIVEDDKRAGEVIRRLRSLLTKGDPQMRALDLNDALGEVARLVSADAVVRGVSIRLELADGLPPVLGDRVQLQQVALNLVLNGMDAMRESGPRDRVLVLRTARADAKTVRVEVRDSGTGINEDDLGKIFQAFYTTKPDGMGMGLAITRSIVDVHGGRLKAHNNPDGGVTFFFTLPIGP